MLRDLSDGRTFKQSLTNRQRINAIPVSSGIFFNRFHLRNKNELIYPAAESLSRKQGSIDYSITQSINTDMAYGLIRSKHFVILLLSFQAC